jgi:hypothetical protein
LIYNSINFDDTDAWVEKCKPAAGEVETVTKALERVDVTAKIRLFDFFGLDPKKVSSHPLSLLFPLYIFPLYLLSSIPTPSLSPLSSIPSLLLTLYPRIKLGRPMRLNTSCMP